jgi:pilus assembly protein CpaB
VSRRRRAALLLALALVLGVLAGSDVARRESALRAQLGPAEPVVVARRPLAAGARVRAGDLAIRRIPARYALAGAAPAPDVLVGRRLAAPVAAGGALTLEHLALPAAAAGPALRRGERAADVVAAGAPAAVVAGTRVDVLVTRERGDGEAGGAELALQDVEVLAAGPAPADAAQRGATGPLVAATLRVTVGQAVFLAAAQSYAREIRLLARAPGDRSRAGAIAVGADLR